MMMASMRHCRFGGSRTQWARPSAAKPQKCNERVYEETLDATAIRVNVYRPLLSILKWDA
jgi:hypothetical protein